MVCELSIKKDSFYRRTFNLILQEFSKSAHGCKLLQNVELVIINDGPLPNEIGVVDREVELASSTPINCAAL